MKNILGLGFVAMSAISFGQVLNGGFESASLGAANGSGSGYWVFNAGNTGLDNWMIGGSSVDIVSLGGYVHSGNYALDIVGTPGPGSVSQTLSLVDGQDYRVTFWAFASSVGVNQTLTVGANSTETTYTVAVANYTQYSFDFTADASSVQLSFASDPGNSGNGNLMLDDIEIEAVPEPASMALLAGGALALARRRKKN